MKVIDLHLHTYFSDGSFSPEELIDTAKKEGLSAVSITDHDTVEGLIQAVPYAQKQGIELVPGVELIAFLGKTEVHMLGYFIDCNSQVLKAYLAKISDLREQRVCRICEKLSSLYGIDIQPQEVLEYSKRGTAGQLHVAKTLVKKGVVSSVWGAFRKYMGEKKLGPALLMDISVEDAISIIRASGGIPVLAHPFLLNRDEVIPRFVEMGLEGLEVYYSKAPDAAVDYYKKLADKYGLVSTGGSDCHGRNRGKIMIGTTRLPYGILEDLKKKKTQLDSSLEGREKNGFL